MDMIKIFLIISGIAGYILGSISSAVILSKLVSGKDIREEGSGNAGATNMLRTHGKKMGVLTLVFDLLKGVVAVLIARLFGNFIDNEFYAKLMPLVSGFFVIIGHNFPIFFGFRGGKGVATSLGVILTLNYKVALFVAAIAILIMALTRYVSLGSVLAGILYVVFDLAYMFFTDTFYYPELIFACLVGGLVVIRHRANIKRLKDGTESKLGEKKEVKEIFNL